MRTPIFALLILLFLATTTSGTAAERVELRGSVAVAYDGATYTWDPQNFPGFSYDADENIGNEWLTLTITDSFLEEPMGVVYETTAQLAEFDLEDWGSYHKISFLGEEHFAGYADESYDERPYLYDKSKDDNLMAGEQLSKILIDEEHERTITKDSPLQLAEGYELAIKGIDAYGSVWLNLTRDGEVVDSNLIAPVKDGATMADKTYTYAKDIGITQGIVVIAVHFKGPLFHGTEGGLQDAAVVDGIWQISDSPVSIGEGSIFGKMRVSSVDPESMRIVMDNQDNQITLSENRDISLMGDFGIKTADQDEISAEEPLRYYVYREITEAGTYEIRGAVSVVVDGEMVEWNPTNFAGFYYDIDEDLGTESLVLNIYDSALEEPNGAVYTTYGQKKDFENEVWGSYWVIGFLGEEHFASYVEGTAFDAYLYEDSANPNLMAAEMISQVLIDDDEERTVTSGTSLLLAEGYELILKSIDASTDKVSLELRKNGQIVDTNTVEPLKEGATVQEKTYTYKERLNGAGEIVVIAVHFKNAFYNIDQMMATVDGVWQISDEPVSIQEETTIGKMAIQAVDAEAKTIMMDNKDNKINLYRNADIPLMGTIRIKTADQDDVTPEEPLRFYIYKEATVEAPQLPAPSQEIGMI